MAANGHNENRLDRIEAGREALVRSQAHLLQAQAAIEQEHKNLLRSQVLMQDELRKFATNTEARLQRGDADVKTRFDESEARFQRIETNLAEATDKLNALIDWMDRHTREHDQGRP